MEKVWPFYCDDASIISLLLSRWALSSLTGFTSPSRNVIVIMIVVVITLLLCEGATSRCFLWTRQKKPRFFFVYFVLLIEFGGSVFFMCWRRIKASFPEARRWTENLANTRIRERRNFRD